MTSLKTLIALGLTLSGCQILWADTITGELVFKKRASFAGVVFVENSQYPIVNATLDQKDKQFTHKMIIVSPGGSIVFHNSDTFEHNIYSSGFKKVDNFDIGLMPIGSQSQISASWETDSIIRIGCKIHPKMKAYIANIESNLYQVLPFEKKKKHYPIKLEGISGDEVAVKLKIPKYVDTVVVLKPGETKTVEVIRKGKLKATLTLQRQ